MIMKRKLIILIMTCIFAFSAFSPSGYNELEININDVYKLSAQDISMQSKPDMLVKDLIQG